MEIGVFWVILEEVIDHGEVGIGVLNEFEPTLIINVGIVLVNRCCLKQCPHLVVERGSIEKL